MANGNWIDIPCTDGTSMRAWLERPAQGSGPGLVLAHDMAGANAYVRGEAALLAEEGYVCLVPDFYARLGGATDLGYDDASVAAAQALRAQFDLAQGLADLGDALAALRALPACRGRVGVVGWSFGGLLAALAAAHLPIACAVSWYGVGLEAHVAEVARARCPLLLQFAAEDAKVPAAARAAVESAIAGNDAIAAVVHAGCGHAFANPARPAYDKTARNLGWSRMLALLRRELGPHYDLSALWDAHTYHEFVTRDVAATMATMVAEPYVNHVPTMTGGVGHEHLERFYRHHFVDANPPDTRLIPVSRTVGVDRLVDEMVFCFTHTCEIPWMLPGVAPTGRYVEVPLVAIVAFRGDKLCHEHIYWDQASVLVQIRLVDPAGLPVAGRATAAKLRDESLPSNALMADAWARSGRG